MDICISADEQFRKELELRRADRRRRQQRFDHVLARRNLEEAEEVLDLARKIERQQRKVLLGKPYKR